MPFTELSTASSPSTFTRFDLARCPLIFSPEVGAAPIEGVSSLASRDGCVCNHATIGIFHNDVQIAGGRALGEGNCAKQQQRNCKRDGFPQIHKFLPGVPRYKKKAKNQNQPSPGGL